MILGTDSQENEAPTPRESSPSMVPKLPGGPFSYANMPQHLEYSLHISQLEYVP